MLLVFILFWLVLIWGLYDGDVYPKEAAIFVVIWLALIACFFFVPKLIIPAVIGTVILDIVLLVKVYGPSGS
jgi:hypothetical protein